MPPALPTFLPLAEAVRKYKLPEKVLTQLIQAGKIEAARLPSGEILVSDQDLDQGKTKEEIIEEKFSHLRGKTITITEGAKKYNVPGSTLKSWVYQYQYIEIVARSFPLKVDEAETAYCADIYRRRKAKGIRSGIPLLDENGRPIDELKHPTLSDYRQRRKRRSTKQ